MWFPYAAPFYVARIAEMRPALIILAAAITIGVLVRKKSRHWTLWIAGFVVGVIVLTLTECRRPRSPLGRVPQHGCLEYRIAHATWLMLFKMRYHTLSASCAPRSSTSCPASREIGRVSVTFLPYTVEKYWGSRHTPVVECVAGGWLMGALFLGAFLGAIFGGIVTILITVWVERLRSPTMRLAIGDCRTIQPRGPFGREWRSLRVAVSNERLRWWASWWLSRSPAQQCRAEILFLRLDGTPFIKEPMIGRWAGGLARAARGIYPTTEWTARAVPYQPGRTKKHCRHLSWRHQQLDVVIRVDQEDQAYGWNNETYFYPNWRNPNRQLNHERYFVKSPLLRRDENRFLSH